jgi:hypothetical protein
VTNSLTTSVAPLRLHRSTVAGCFVVQRKFSREASWGFAAGSQAPRCLHAIASSQGTARRKMCCDGRAHALFSRAWNDDLQVKPGVPAADSIHSPKPLRRRCRPQTAPACDRSDPPFARSWSSPRRLRPGEWSAGCFHVNEDTELHVDGIVVRARGMSASCELRSTGPRNRSARRTSGQRRWRPPHRAAQVMMPRDQNSRDET